MIRRFAGAVPIQIIFILALIVALASCKLRVKVPEGGRVVSASGAYECIPEKPCKIDVVDIFFSENFIAQAAQGYYFRRWKGGDHTLCGDTYGSCRLSTAAFEGNAVLESFLMSDEVFFLRPLFARGNCDALTDSTEDVFGNIVRLEGLQCKDSDRSSPKYQGIVKTYRNDALISVAGYDQGRLHGTEIRYSEDGTTLEERSEYRDGLYQGARKQYDEQGRLVSISRWKQGKLQGKSIAYDYLSSDPDDAEAIISTSNYENGKLNGTSTIEYPGGAWESRQWDSGVQYGEYQVFVPNSDDDVLGFRYVYGFSGGLIRYGSGFTRFAIPGSDDFREVPGPVWQCVYVDGVLDEEDCFRDGLDTLGPRL
jgi:antitoxin component YwqK of YwqJK toxin-antitoxin module